MLSYGLEIILFIHQNIPTMKNLHVVPQEILYIRNVGSAMEPDNADCVEEQENPHGLEVGQCLRSVVHNA
jgi:hypothetical protein